VAAYGQLAEVQGGVAPPRACTMGERDLGFLVFFLGMVPSYALVCMNASFVNPSRRDWLLVYIGSAIALVAAFAIIVVAAGSLAALVGGLIFGGLCGLYENSKGPRGSDFGG
jgi:hypothetical protein